MGMLLIVRPYYRELFSAAYWRSLVRVGEVMRLVHRNFVTGDAVAYPTLTENALRAIMADLDDYSQYMDKQSFAQFSMESDQHYVGIGVEIQWVDFRVTIGEIFTGSPAGEAGIQSGDQIISVDGENTEASSVNEMSNVLRGQAGTDVTVTVYRPLEDQTYTFTFPRKPIDFPSIRKVEVSDDDWKLGYVRLVQFGRRSAAEFVEALNTLEEQGVRGLVFDLRNNPGGVLPIAVDIAGQFIEDGKMVVSTRGRDQDIVTSAYADNGGNTRDYPIVVLINEYSASASEIVAGALQDYGRAIIVGQTSVGKGTVQSIYQLGDEVGLRMTTAKYYLPSGRTIHQSGVKPDVAVDISEAERLKLFTQRNHLRYLDDVAFEKRFGFQPIQDAQLEAAYSLLRGILAFRRAPAVVSR